MTYTTTPPVAAAPRRPGATSTVLGIVLLIIGLFVAGGGGAVLLAGVAADGIRRIQGDDGFLTAGPIALSADSYAISSPTGEPLTVETDIPNFPFDVATLRMTVESADGPVFIGVAAQDDIDRYLEGVEHSEVRRLSFRSEVRYREYSGTAPAEAPEDVDIWVSSATGSGPQDVQWSLTPGEWGVVIMNPDGGRGIDVETSVGVRSDFIAPAATALLALGGTVLFLGLAAIVVGAVLIGVGQRGLRPPGGSAPGQPPQVPHGAAV
jgi:hypothetical protein